MIISKGSFLKKTGTFCLIKDVSNDLSTYIVLDHISKKFISVKIKFMNIPKKIAKNDKITNGKIIIKGDS
jgi:hypothetical protein